MRTAYWRRTLGRAGRRTNLALFWLLLAAFATGWVGFAVADPTPARLIAVGHGLLGLAVLLLAPWKTMIIRRARPRPAGIALAVVVVLGLAAGFGQFFLGWGTWLPLSPMQLHVGAGLIVLPLLGWHVFRHGRRAAAMIRVRRADLSRRALLRGAALAGAAGAGYLLLDELARSTTASDRRAAPTGSRPVDPDAIPATIWLLDRVPVLDPSYRVDVAGAALSAADLAQQAETVTARLDCTSGWYADADWTGRRIVDLVPAPALAAARSVLVTSETGYSRRFPTAAADDLWLVVGCQGRPLTAETGAPIRLVAPGRRGFWWVKWVARVELSDVDSWRQPPFPLQ